MMGRSQLIPPILLPVWHSTCFFSFAAWETVKKQTKSTNGRLSSAQKTTPK
jgi:hypothetical protein